MKKIICLLIALVLMLGGSLYGNLQLVQQHGQATAELERILAELSTVQQTLADSPGTLTDIQKSIDDTNGQVEQYVAEVAALQAELDQLTEGYSQQAQAEGDR